MQLHRSIQLLSAVLLLFCGRSIYAQSLTISVSDDSLSTDDELVVILDGSLGNFSNYATLPDIPGLIVISHQESFNYNGASKSATVHQTYVMKAINAGDYTIGPAWIQAGSRRVYSNTEHVKITAGDNPLSNGMVFLRCEPDKRDVYTGEKIRVAVRLYVAEDYYVSGDYPIAESYSGFWVEPNFDDIDYEYTDYEDDSVVFIKGKKFRRRTLLKESLYPNAIGDLTLPAYVYTCYLSQNDADVYSYDSYNMSFDLRSEQSVITSRPLPDHDSLPGFAGDVGQFTITTSISSDSTKAWEPVTYTMWISGEGNFQFMMAPTLVLPAGLRAQTIMNSDTSVFNAEQGKYCSAKMFRYLITPEKEGEYDLSGIAFSYFDPQQEKYVTIYADSLHLHVDPGQKIAGDAVNNLPDSFFNARKAKGPAMILTLCAALLIAPVLVFFIVRARKKKKLEREAEAARLAALKEEVEYTPPPDTSLEQANALIHGAGQYLQNGLVIQSVNNLYEAMIVRISGITKMRREEISVNTLRYRLKLVRLNENVINDIVEQLEDLKLKRYTLSPADGAAAHILIVRTADLVRKMG